MRNFERILLGIALLSLILKFFLITGGGILCVLSFSVLSGFYFYLGFAYFNDLKMSQIFKSSSYKMISNKRLIGGICSGLALSILLIGFMFKLMQWPGQTMNLILGLLCTFVILAIIVITTKGKIDLYYKRILIRLALTGLLGLFFIVISDSVIIKIQYRNYPRYIEAFKKLQEQPSSVELQENIDKERSRIFMTDQEFEFTYKEKK